MSETSLGAVNGQFKTSSGSKFVYKDPMVVKGKLKPEQKKKSNQDDESLNLARGPPPMSFKPPKKGEKIVTEPVLDHLGKSPRVGKEQQKDSKTATSMVGYLTKPVTMIATATTAPVKYIGSMFSRSDGKQDKRPLKRPVSGTKPKKRSQLVAPSKSPKIVPKAKDVIESQSDDVISAPTVLGMGDCEQPRRKQRQVANTQYEKNDKWKTLNSMGKKVKERTLHRPNSQSPIALIRKEAGTSVELIDQQKGLLVAKKDNHSNTTSFRIQSAEGIAKAEREMKKAKAANRNNKHSKSAFVPKDVENRRNVWKRPDNVPKPVPLRMTTVDQRPEVKGTDEMSTEYDNIEPIDRSNSNHISTYPEIAIDNPSFMDEHNIDVKQTPVEPFNSITYKDKQNEQEKQIEKSVKTELKPRTKSPVLSKELSDEPIYNQKNIFEYMPVIINSKSKDNELNQEPGKKSSPHKDLINTPPQVSIDDLIGKVKKGKQKPVVDSEYVPMKDAKSVTQNNRTQKETKKKKRIKPNKKSSFTKADSAIIKPDNEKNDKSHRSPLFFKRQQQGDKNTMSTSALEPKGKPVKAETSSNSMSSVASFFSSFFSSDKEEKKPKEDTCIWDDIQTNNTENPAINDTKQKQKSPLRFKNDTIDLHANDETTIIDLKDNNEITVKNLQAKLETTIKNIQGSGDSTALDLQDNEEKTIITSSDNGQIGYIKSARKKESTQKFSEPHSPEKSQCINNTQIIQSVRNPEKIPSQRSLEKIPSVRKQTENCSENKQNDRLEVEKVERNICKPGSPKTAHNKTENINTPLTKTIAMDILSGKDEHAGIISDSDHNKAKPEHINVSSYQEPIANRLDGKQNSNLQLPVECKSSPFKSNIETKKSPKISPSQKDMDEENTNGIIKTMTPAYVDAIQNQAASNVDSTPPHDNEVEIQTAEYGNELTDENEIVFETNDHWDNYEDIQGSNYGDNQVSNEIDEFSYDETETANFFEKFIVVEEDNLKRVPLFGKTPSRAMVRDTKRKADILASKPSEHILANKWAASHKPALLNATPMKTMTKQQALAFGNSHAIPRAVDGPHALAKSGTDNKKPSIFGATQHRFYFSNCNNQIASSPKLDDENEIIYSKDKQNSSESKMSENQTNNPTLIGLMKLIESQELPVPVETFNSGRTNNGLEFDIPHPQEKNNLCEKQVNVQKKEHSEIPQKKTQQKKRKNKKTITSQRKENNNNVNKKEFDNQKPASEDTGNIDRNQNVQSSRSPKIFSRPNEKSTEISGKISPKINVESNKATSLFETLRNFFNNEYPSQLNDYPSDSGEGPWS